MPLRGLLLTTLRHLTLAHGLTWAAAALLARNHKQAAAIEREAIAAADAIDDVLTERNVTRVAALMATVTVAARTVSRAAHTGEGGGPAAFLRRRLQEEA